MREHIVTIPASPETVDDETLLAAVAEQHDHDTHQAALLSYWPDGYEDDADMYGNIRRYHTYTVRWVSRFDDMPEDDAHQSSLDRALESNE